MSSFDFDKHVFEFFQEFPDKLGRVFFIDAGICKDLKDFETIYPHIVNDIDELDEQHTKNIDIFEIEEILAKYQETPNMQASTSIIFNEDGVPISTATVIIFSKTFVDDFYASLKRENEDKKSIDAYYETMLNHEIGHCLFDSFLLEQALQKANEARDNNRTGFGKSNDLELTEQECVEFSRASTSEAVAEAYALIRLHQKYGIDSDVAKDWIAIRAKDRFEFPFDTHNFMPSINVVVDMARTGELDNLTPEESFYMACRIGVGNALSCEDNMEINKNLKQVYNEISQKGLGDSSIAKLKQVVSNTSSLVSLKDIHYAVDGVANIPTYPKELKAKLLDVKRLTEAKIRRLKKSKNCGNQA